MRKCSMTYKQARKTVALARDNLDMSKQSLLWSKELEVECFRLIDTQKKAEEQAAAEEQQSQRVDQSKLVTHFVGGLTGEMKEQSNTETSESHATPPSSPSASKKQLQEPLSARQKTRGKSAGRAAARKLLLSPQKARRSSISRDVASSEPSTRKPSATPSQSSIESKPSLAVTLSKDEKDRRRSSLSDDSYQTGGCRSQDSICSADSTTSGSRFRRSKRSEDGRRKSLSRAAGLPTKSPSVNSADVDENVPPEGESGNKKVKKKIKKKAKSKEEVLTPSPAKRKKKKDKSLDSSLHTSATEDSHEGYSKQNSKPKVPKTPSKTKDPLDKSSTHSTRSSKSSKRKVPKSKLLSVSPKLSTTNKEQIGNNLFAEDSMGGVSNQFRPKTKEATDSKAPSSSGERSPHRTSLRKISLDGQRARESLDNPTVITDRATFTKDNDDPFEFCNPSPSETLRNRIHDKLRQSPTKRQKAPKIGIMEFEDDDPNQSSFRSLASNSSKSSKTRMVPVVRSSPKSPFRETNEKFLRPTNSLRSCGSNTKKKCKPRRASDFGMSKTGLLSSPSKAQDRFAAFIANNLDSPESFLSPESLSASQRDMFQSPESSPSKTLPCFPSLSPTFDDKSTSLTPPRQPTRQVSKYCA